MKLYIHNDLHLFQKQKKVSQKMLYLLQLLETALLQNTNIQMITVDEQVENLAEDAHEVYPLTIAVGTAGLAIARKLQAHTKLFPCIQLVSLQRKEMSEGNYKVFTTHGPTIKEILLRNREKKIAIVDDTIYSGLTLSTILKQFSPRLQREAHIFSLVAIKDSVEELKKYARVSTGVLVSGKRDREVSIIKASGLFEPGAIKKIDGSDLAFYQRPFWIRAWFPANADEIIALSQKLHFLTEANKTKQEAQWPLMRLFASPPEPPAS